MDKLAEISKSSTVFCKRSAKGTRRFFNHVNITAGFSTSLAQAKIAFAEMLVGA